MAEDQRHLRPLIRLKTIRLPKRGTSQGMGTRGVGVAPSRHRAIAPSRLIPRDLSHDISSRPTTVHISTRIQRIITLHKIAPHKEQNSS